MTEKEYRALDIDSYSTIKEFLDDRKEYYRIYVLKEKEEKSTESLIFGTLIDCLRFTPEEFENKFAMAINQEPTGQYKKFVDALMKVTIANTNEEGEITREFALMMEDAYNMVKFDRDGNIVDFKRDGLDAVKTKFIGTDLESYYRQLRDSRGKIVISLSTLEKAQELVNTLSSNFVTSLIINQRTEKTIEVFDQFIIIGEMSSELTKSIPYPLKGMIDRLVIDHNNKVIHIFDLKHCWDNEWEFMANYLKYRYYIQGVVYYYLTVEWKKKQKGLENYLVSYPQFIVAESNNYKNPLIYPMDKTNFEQGMRGFVYRGRTYVGLLKALSDLKWHKENGIWNISKDNYESNGRVSIPRFE